MNLQRLLSPIRWVHIHLTMLGFGIICLFAVTGLLLNHRENLGLDDTKTITATGKLPAPLTTDAPRAAIFQELHRQMGLTGKIDTFEADDRGIRIVLERPGSRSEVTIDHDDGQIEVNTESGAFLAILTDLHRGHGTGVAWTVVIDLAAALLLISSLTGLVMVLNLSRRRGMALAFGTAGVVACVGLAWLASR